MEITLLQSSMVLKKAYAMKLSFRYISKFKDTNFSEFYQWKVVLGLIKTMLLDHLMPNISKNFLISWKNQKYSNKHHINRKTTKITIEK